MRASIEDQLHSCRERREAPCCPLCSTVLPAMLLKQLSPSAMKLLKELDVRRHLQRGYA